MTSVSSLIGSGLPGRSRGFSQVKDVFLTILNYTIKLAKQPKSRGKLTLQASTIKLQLQSIDINDSGHFHSKSRPGAESVSGD